MKRISPLWLALGGAAVLALAAWSVFGGDGEDAAYRLEPVDRGDIVVNISATGTLNALTTVQVGSQVSGTIARLYADFNSVVREGQLLAQLDPTFLQATVNGERANMERATAQVHEAERNFGRTSDLASKGLVSQADMDAATTALEAARATLRQSQATLERAEVNLRYATIRAPISGVVISRDVDVGQTVAASLQAPTLFTIANDLRKMQVQASVDEADIGAVRAGQHVTFRVDAYPEREFEGIVSQIRLAPVITQNVVTYTVIIDVENRDGTLMPGMTATVSIEVARREDVLRVPLLALRFTPPDAVTEAARPPDGGENRGRGGARGRRDATAGRVWVLDGDTPVPVRVQRGVQNVRHAEVESDSLKEGDRVIVGVNSGPAQVQAQPQNPLMPRMPGGGGRRGF